VARLPVLLPGWCVHLPEIPLIGSVPLLRSEEKAYVFGEPDQALIDIGLFETGHKFRFRCLICGKVEVNDQRMEPVCTGPGWTDTHPHEVMQLEIG
jgi:hypothetical protein